jgi:hypothetical protein
MIVYFEPREAALVEAIGYQRFMKAKHYNSDTQKTLDKDRAGVAGEVGLLQYLGLDITSWNALWNYDLPDVDRYEIRTSNLNQPQLYIPFDRVQKNPNQIWILAWTDDPSVRVNLLGWTRASYMESSGFYDYQKRLYRLPEADLMPMSELLSAA